MGKFILPLIAIILLTSCKKQISEDLSGVSSKKITICHYDKDSGTSHTIEVSKNELAAHLAHGDLEGDCSSVIITICDQVWMVKNLDVATFRNGDPILNITNDDGWASTYFNRKAAYCYYNNDSATYAATYGKLYNLYAVTDPRGLAPVGWHVATHQDWVTLAVNCLRGEPVGLTHFYDVENISIAGSRLKESGTTHWASPNFNATNSSGFTGLPGGWRDKNGPFKGIGLAAFWTIGNAGDMYYSLSYNYDDLHFSWDYGFASGNSIRCVRD